MTMTAVGDSWRYSAFISYSHRDAACARDLQSRLEAYRLPKELRGRSDLVDVATGRLRPCFRDREELAAGPDLSKAVRTAIAASRYLLVVCTPNTPKSEWVGREIALARAIRGPDALLAAVFAGDYASAVHPALVSTDPSEALIQPVAADFQPTGDGAGLALLKLVAVFAGVELDQLARRDAMRRRRRAIWAGCGAAAGALALTVLATLMLSARAEARREQQRGVTMIAQLVDQREQLSKAGRLSLLQAQDRVALGFFRGRDVATLPPAAQLLSARLLQAISDDSERAGDLAGLQEAAGAAARLTAPLLDDHPADPERLMAHAQSEYWVGLGKWRGGDIDAARTHFVAYARLAARLASGAPDRREWQREAGDADSNLASFALRTGDYATAERLFRAAQHRFARAAGDASDREAQIDLADGYGWLAAVERIRGNLPEAWANRVVERRLLLAMRARDPDDAEIETALIKNLLGMARVAALQGRWTDANAMFDAGRTAARARARTDRANADIRQQLRAFDLFQVRAWLDMPAAERPPLSAMMARVGRCGGRRDPSSEDEAARFCTILSARVLALAGARNEARALLRQPCPRPLSDRWNIDLCAELQLAEATIPEGE